MQLDPKQLLIATAAASILFWLITWLWMGVLKKPKPKDKWLRGGVFGVSVVLAYVSTPIELPVLGDDIFAFVFALLVSANAVFGLAKLFYDVIWQRIVEGLASFQPLAFLSTRR